MISGYRAVLNRAAVGLGFETMVFVTMQAADRDTLDGFESAVTELPNVVDAQRLFGEPDYLLRVVAADLAGFQQLYDDHLATLPGVQRLSTTLVMKAIVSNRQFPFGPTAADLSSTDGRALPARPERPF